jgi:phosphoribosylformylglycinamidine cyclo-ligase
MGIGPYLGALAHPPGDSKNRRVPFFRFASCPKIGPNPGNPRRTFSRMAKATYKDSGVDLEVYEQSMARLPRLLRRTHSPRVLPAEGGFAGLFQLDFPAGLFARRYVDPVLVSGTDGVGTKLKVAQLAHRHDTVGIDLVAMCVNDILCTGAEPLFFLDYVAMSKDDPALLESLVKGISDGCILADAALVGGETAIMPDLYRPGDYDLAGFAVGVVERAKVLDGSTISPGDTVIGVASSGLHSNGYSLVRKIVFELAGLGEDDSVKPCGGTVGDVLLTPTTIYTRAVRSVLSHYKVKSVVHGIAHITGGGLHENLARIFPPGLGATIDRGSWPTPPVFAWLQELGDVDDDEMYRVFNMGIGLSLVVSPYYADSIRQQLATCGLDSWVIGRVVAGDQEVKWA